MTIKQDEWGTYTVWHCKRHPITKKPMTLRREKVKSVRLAKQVEQELIIELDMRARKSVTPNWTQVVGEYIDYMGSRDISRKTVDCYRLCLEAHTFTIWGEKLITDISSHEIRELVNVKLVEHSPSHRKNILKYIRGAFNFACEKKYIGFNPVPIMKFKIGNKLKDVLTLQQASTLLTQAKIVNSEWYPIWAMALYTGMRNGELYALTWDKVNLDNRIIKVDCSWNSQDGFKETKSGDDRIVEIAPELLLILKELKLRNINPPFVLPRIDKWDKGEQARELRRFLEGLALPRIRFHDLRATWATIMLSNGIEPIKVMIMGGWKDLKTMQLYIRKAGVDTNGISNKLSLHNPSFDSKVIAMV